MRSLFWMQGLLWTLLSTFTANASNSHTKANKFNKIDWQQRTALYRALADGNDARVRDLLEKGAKPYVYGTRNPLIPAVLLSSVEMVKLLLDRGAKILYSNGQGEQNALIYAAKMKRWAHFALLEARAERSMVIWSMSDLVDDATATCDATVLKILAEKYGWTVDDMSIELLHFSFQQCRPKNEEDLDPRWPFFEFLVHEVGFDINTRSQDGYHLLEGGRNAEELQFLFDLGADPNSINLDTGLLLSAGKDLSLEMQETYWMAQMSLLYGKEAVAKARVCHLCNKKIFAREVLFEGKYQHVDCAAKGSGQ